MAVDNEDGSRTPVASDAVFVPSVAGPPAKAMASTTPVINAATARIAKPLQESSVLRVSPPSGDEGSLM